MDSKKHVKIPKDTLGQIILSGLMAEKISKRATTKEEILNMLKRRDVKLTDKVKTELKKAFPSFDFD